jgi:cellulose synthase/poly-beta-1,6-N-acetylglucosamine synthase-like glycosyltransferase
MKISVAIPAHNEESYIAQCLESLGRQDFEDLTPWPPSRSGKGKASLFFRGGLGRGLS